MMSDDKKAKERRQIAKAWSLVAQTGLIVIVSVAIGLAAGIWIDSRFSLKYRPATILLSLWGLISGFVRAYQLIRHQLGQNDQDSLAGVYDRLRQEKDTDFPESDDEEDDW